MSNYEIALLPLQDKHARRNYRTQYNRIATICVEIVYMGHFVP